MVPVVFAMRWPACACVYARVCILGMLAPERSAVMFVLFHTDLVSVCGDVQHQRAFVVHS